MGSFLFLSPSGIGRRSLQRCLQSNFGDWNTAVPTDMNKCTEAHSVARLIGAPPLMRWA